MSWTATQKRNMLNNFNVVAQRTRLGDLVYGFAGGSAGPLDYGGTSFYVNNVTGSDTTGDGLSWGTAFAQVTKAITASETARAVFTTANATNVAIKNTIYVQGTATAYNALTALPLHCRIIGIGDLPFGNGQGIPVIGVSGASGAVSTSDTIRGCEFYNVQFATGTGAYWCLDLLGSFLRGAFVNCSFLVSGTTTTGGCLRAQGSFAGNLVQHCQFSGDAGYPTYGIYLTGGSINNNIIEDNLVGGITHAVHVAAGDDVNTVWRNNTIGISYPGGGTAVGAYDHSSGYAIWAGNFIVGTDAMDMGTNGTKRTVGNYVINTTTGAVEI